MLGQHPSSAPGSVEGIGVGGGGWGRGTGIGVGMGGCGRAGPTQLLSFSRTGSLMVPQICTEEGLCALSTPQALVHPRLQAKGTPCWGYGEVAALPVAVLGETQAGDGDASFRCLVPGRLTEMVGLITPSPFPLAVTLFELTVVNNWYIIMVRTLASSWERLPLTLWGQLCVSLHPVWGPCPSHGLRGVASWATGSAFCGRPPRGPRSTPWLDMAFVPAPHPHQPGDAQPVLPPTGETFQSRSCGGFPSLNSSKCHPTRGRLSPGTSRPVGRGILDPGTCVFLNRGAGREWGVCKEPGSAGATGSLSGQPPRRPLTASSASRKASPLRPPTGAASTS